MLAWTAFVYSEIFVRRTVAFLPYPPAHDKTHALRRDFRVHECSLSICTMALLACFALLVFCFSMSVCSVLICPFESEKYKEANRVLAIEDYSYGRIDAETLDGVDVAVPELEVLILRNTGVEVVAPGTFLRLKTIKCLDLSRNKISALTSDFFRGLGQLHTLILNENLLTYLRDSTFVSVKKLRMLDLSNNRLEEISAAGFRGLSNLHEIHLEDNNLSYISGLVFQHIRTLEKLFLSRNPLLTVDISPLFKLQLFYASETEINLVPRFPYSIQEVDLSYSNLTTLPSVFFENTRNLRQIRLGGNSWHCDCFFIQRFVDFAKNFTNIIGNNEFVCRSPESVEKASFTNAYLALRCPKNLIGTAGKVNLVQQFSTVSSKPVSFHFTDSGGASIEPGLIGILRLSQSKAATGFFGTLDPKLSTTTPGSVTTELFELVTEKKATDQKPTDFVTIQHQQTTSPDIRKKDSSFLSGKVSLKVVLLSSVFGLCFAVILFACGLTVKVVIGKRGIVSRYNSRPSPFCTVSPYCGDVIMKNSLPFRQYKSDNLGFLSGRNKPFPKLFAATVDGDNLKDTESSSDNSVSSKEGMENDYIYQ